MSASDDRPIRKPEDDKKLRLAYVCMIMKQLNPEYLLKENVHEEAE
jgi:site-specific DNA-cytosine methylase